MRFEIAPGAGETDAPARGSMPLYEGYFDSVLTAAVSVVAGDGFDVIYRGRDLRPREAARLCAHALHSWAISLDVDAREGDTPAPDWLYGTAGRGGSIGLVDPEVATAIDTGIADDRFAAGAALVRGLGGTGAAGAEGARLVGKWLVASATPGARADVAAGHLARWVMVNGAPRLREHFGAAWWRIHGAEVIAQVRGDEPPAGRGRPTVEQRRHLAMLAVAVAATYTAGGWTKQDLAAEAGISRPTLDAWLTNHREAQNAR